MTTETDAFAARLRKLLADRKLPASPADLAALLARHGASVSAQAVSGWLGGRYMPKAPNQRALAALLGISRLALLEDAGATPRQGVRESPPDWQVGVDGKDAIAFREFTTLPAAQRRLVRELILVLASASGQGGKHRD